MAAGKAESVHLPSPPGVEFALTEQGARVRVRAGALSPAMTIAFILAAIWTALWARPLADLINAMRDGHAGEPSARLFIFAVMILAGLYCAALCLWTMIGHQRLIIRDGKLLLENPWLLGFQKRRYELSSVGAFSCAGKDCGVEADAKSCCCAWSSVDYALLLDAGGRRASIFTHLPREAKDWLRDRLNGVLAQKQLPRDQ